MLYFNMTVIGFFRTYSVVGAGVVIFIIMSSYIGAIIYANYKLCDPLANGTLTSRDQVTTLY